MKYELHILGAEQDNSATQEELDAYIDALISEIGELHEVSNIRRHGHVLLISLSNTCPEEALHSAIRNILVNYFDHLGPFDYAWVDAVIEAAQ